MFSVDVQRVPLEITLRLLPPELSGQVEPELTVRPSMVEQMLSGLVVRVAVHLVPPPGRAPDNTNNDMNKQFIICNIQAREPLRNRGVKIFICLKVKGTNSRSAIHFTFS